MTSTTSPTSRIGLGHTPAEPSQQASITTTVQIDVDKLLTVDYSHLRVAISHILSLLSASESRAQAQATALQSIGSKCEGLERQHMASNQAFRHMQEKVAEQQRELDSLKSMEALQNDKISTLQNQVSALETSNAGLVERAGRNEKLNEVLKETHDQMQSTIEQLQTRLTEASTQLALHSAQLDQLQAAQGQEKPAIVATPVLTAPVATGSSPKVQPVVSTAPVPSLPSAPPTPSASTAYSSTINLNGQIDALNLRLKQISNNVEALSGRVGVLELRRASTILPTGSSPSTTSTPAPAAAAASAGAGISAAALDAMLEPYLAQQAQLSKQVNSNVLELQELQRTLYQLQQQLGEKASIVQLDHKADKNQMDELQRALDSWQDKWHIVEFEQAQQNEQLTTQRDLCQILSSKLQELINSQACAICHDEKPAYKCNQCGGMCLCERCDVERHEGSENEERMRHVRVPLTGITNITNVTNAPAATTAAAGAQAAAAPSFHFNPHSSALDHALRQWCEEQFSLLQKKERATRADIHDLYEKDKESRGKMGEMSKVQKEQQTLIEELQAALKRVEMELNIKINSVQSTSKNYTDHRCEELLLKLRELEKALEKGMKSELKRFERDVMVFMEDSKHEQADAAAGKIHFRCLSCDQYINTLQGPASLLYSRAVGAQAAGLPSASTTMQIDRGRELYLSGRDGQVYKGRDASIVTVVPGDPAKAAAFQVSYSERMPTTNPTRASIRDQNTVALSSYTPGGGGTQAGISSTSLGSTTTTTHSTTIHAVMPPLHTAGSLTARPNTAPDEEKMLAGARAALPPATARPSTQHRARRAFGAEEKSNSGGNSARNSRTQE